MKKMINIRNSVIVILCITIVCMVIGFIVMAVELKKKKDDIPSYNVVFTKIVKSSSVKGSTIEPFGSGKIDEHGKILHMNFQLNAIHDEIVYVATIQNQGTLPCKIVDILESPNYKKAELANMISPVTIQLSDIENKELKSQEEIELKMVVYYNPSTSDVKARAFTYDLGLITESVKKA